MCREVVVMVVVMKDVIPSIRKKSSRAQGYVDIRPQEEKKCSMRSTPQITSFVLLPAFFPCRTYPSHLSHFHRHSKHHRPFRCELLRPSTTVGNRVVHASDAVNRSCDRQPQHRRSRFPASARDRGGGTMDKRRGRCRGLYPSA